jgi:hypothetical protein
MSTRPSIEMPSFHGPEFLYFSQKRQKIGIERFYFKKEWFHEGETEIVL